jgi:hypothetical protein
MPTLYHGSNSKFEVPSLEFARDKRDFGIGFYTTTIKGQAEAWAHNLFERYGGEGAYLYTFGLAQIDDLGVKEFQAISTEWLDMVKNNRLSSGVQHNFDVVIGPVANDNTIRTVALYVAGIIDAEYAMKQLAFFKANDQVSLHTKKAMDKLIFKGRESLA